MEEIGWMGGTAENKIQEENEWKKSWTKFSNNRRANQEAVRTCFSSPPCLNLSSSLTSHSVFPTYPVSAGIGFNFAGKRLDFETRFKQLLEFVREHGHTRGKWYKTRVNMMYVR